MILVSSWLRLVASEGTWESSQNIFSHQILSTKETGGTSGLGWGGGWPLNQTKTAADAFVGVGFKEQKGKSVLGSVGILIGQVSQCSRIMNFDFWTLVF